ncbi:SulP family inorganic anion transporter [Brevibacterium permense]|uniref:SulP family inorganic anion transporter n=1 Tax=Brevibacterium permense TaxID=234834 RepID=UPI0021D295DB
MPWPSSSCRSSLFGGIPATDAIARTPVNIRAGGRTRLASIVHAAVLLLIVPVAAGPVSRIPLAALGGVLFVTAVRMVDLKTTRSILRSTKSDAVGFVITALITISFNLIVAVGIGVVVAAVFRSAEAVVAHLGAHRTTLGIRVRGSA